MRIPAIANAIHAPRDSRSPPKVGHSKPGSKHCRARGPRGPRLGHAKGACPMPNARPLQYIQRIRMFTSYNTSFDFIAFMRVM